MPERALALIAALLALAGCAAPQEHPGRFSFAVMGDVPYGAREELRFGAMLQAIDREPVAFTVHVGDIKGGGACSDALYGRRRAQFDRSAHPFVYTPGDNEWADCRRLGHDPLERLARLREVFFAAGASLGRRAMALDVQSACAEVAPDGCRCPALPENRAWSHGGVRFVALHVVGSNDNVGFDAASDEEARCRSAANGAWLARAVDAARAPGMRALVVFLQANPWEGRRRAYERLLRDVSAAAHRLGRPLLLVHGDTHTYRVDAPFADALGITRLETFGSPFMGWVRVTVDPDDPQLFGFEPRLFAVVPPR